MARVMVPTQDEAGSYADTGLTLVGTPNDAANGMQCLYSPDTVVLARNSDNNGDHTVTMLSTTDSHGRTNDIVMTLVEGQIVVLGPFKRDGWRQEGGYLWFHGDAADIRWAAVRRVQR